jgi:hypothetical protein
MGKLLEIFKVKSEEELMNMDLNIATYIWFEFILTHKKSILEEIDRDIADTIGIPTPGYEYEGKEYRGDKNILKEELLFVKNLIENTNPYRGERAFKSINEILTYWPTLFLPYPNFVEKYYQQRID